MSHGGARRGAGRKPGQATKMNEEARQAVAETGETPLDYMLRVMRDRSAEHSRRDDMAKAAANYVHARLSTTDSTVKSTVQVTKIEELIVDPVVASSVMQTDGKDQSTH